MTETTITPEQTTDHHVHEHHEDPGPLGPCEREISVEIAPEVVAKETTASVQHYQKTARIPGFRKGKVPAGLIRKRFAQDISSQVVESLLPRYFREAAERERIHPISQPRVIDFHMHEGEPLRFKARFEILPEVDINGYREITVEKPRLELLEEEFDAELTALTERQSTFLPVEEEREIRVGDWAQVSFVGHVKHDESSGADSPQGDSSGDSSSDKLIEAGAAAGDKPDPLAKADDVLVEINGANTIKEFSENLLGAKSGEQRTFDTHYAEDFPEKNLAGKTITYRVTVSSIKKKQMPELNDEFAKELGEFQSLDEFKSKYREQLNAQRAQRERRNAKEQLVEKLVDRFQFPVPDSLVERQTDVRLERGLRALAAQGMREEHMRKMDFKRLREGQHEPAVRELRASLILDKIADQERIEITEDELHQEMEVLALQAKQTPEALRQRLTREGALDRIRDRMRNEKTLDFVYEGMTT